MERWRFGLKESKLLCTDDIIWTHLFLRLGCKFIQWENWSTSLLLGNDHVVIELQGLDNIMIILTELWETTLRLVLILSLFWRISFSISTLHLLVVHDLGINVRLSIKIISDQIKLRNKFRFGRIAITLIRIATICFFLIKAIPSW